MKFLVFLFCTFILSTPPQLVKKTIVLQKKELVVEVAEDFRSRYQGLMHRTSLAENEGMLFVFDQPQIMSFWMKDTYLSLSIGYFDKNKVLKEIHQMRPQNMMEKKQDLKSYVSKTKCKYALEVNQGWFKKNNIKIGTQFSFRD